MCNVYFWYFYFSCVVLSWLIQTQDYIEWEKHFLLILNHSKMFPVIDESILYKGGVFISNSSQMSLISGSD